MNALLFCPRGYPILTWLGGTHPVWVPLHLGLEYPLEGTRDQSWGYSQKGHGTSGSIMGYRWGTPRKDMDQRKYYGMEMSIPRKDKVQVEILWDGDGVHPPSDDGHTEVKTSEFSGNAVGNKIDLTHSTNCWTLFTFTSVKINTLKNHFVKYYIVGNGHSITSFVKKTQNSMVKINPLWNNNKIVLYHSFTYKSIGSLMGRFFQGTINSWTSFVMLHSDSFVLILGHTFSAEVLCFDFKIVVFKLQK